MMKRILSMLLAFAFIISLAACLDDRHREEAQPLSNKQSSMEESEAPVSERVESDKEENGAGIAEDTAEKSRILIAYFTWAENVMPDDIDAMTSASVKSPGNVAQLAQWIGGETGGDLFSIQVAEPYPADWDDCLSRANKEKADGITAALPESVVISDHVFHVYQDDVASAEEDLQIWLNELQYE